ncbi:MAG: hypothetical protein JXR88_03710 [Clostridia bacterium]|nr:hypothetical protein [Clostridia bacterium]
MKYSNLYYGETLLKPNDQSVSSETVTIHHETYFKIENYHQMKPFFMTIVSDVDFWLFISSTGGLTAGRKNPEMSLFPYYTDDKIHDSHDTTGSHTMFIISRDQKNYLWKPFAKHDAHIYNITRNLYKNTLGNKIMFEEINHDLQVSFRYTWKTSDRFGFIKESELVNLSEENLTLKVLDGIRNIMPYGVDQLLQTTKSTLVDGYKRCELKEEDGLGIYTLSSIISDKAEPSESLKATTVWSRGLSHPKYLLSEEQIQVFSNNEPINTEKDIKGRRGAFYVSDTLELMGSEAKSWVIVSEIYQSASDIVALIDHIGHEDIMSILDSDVKKGDENLKKLVYNADGFQLTAHENAGYRHFSNTLFNIMRGGIYADDYKIETKDFISFMKGWNIKTYEAHQSFLETLEETIEYQALIDLVSDLNSADLERLAMEYLPLTFSRRHGDPSRPWNRFNIEVTKANGEKNLNFEGNWRDIFQNWEALSMSYPSFIEGIISKFVNASTADGYNPYRITKDGIDWELVDPHDPWSNIGYWGDHQIIYLLKLMELSQKHHHHKLKDLLEKQIFVYANVPYRIKGFDDLVKDPRNTITFDEKCEASVEEKVKTLGFDGKLLFAGGELYHVNLMEKILVTLLAKLSNYVPEGGIWMNTQRPEWNDANNALVGYGVSMVTLNYLYRFLDFMAELVKDLDHDLEISVEVLEMFKKIYQVFENHLKYIGHDISDHIRFSMITELNRIGEDYRNKIYNAGFSQLKKPLSLSELNDFIQVSKSHLKDTITKNKREDGLYHAYNLIVFSEAGCHISHLYEMLEGQVAVLSSKALNAEASLEVLEALRNSAIYRADQDSYMLYPNRELPGFLNKNIIPEEKVFSSKLLITELKNGLTRFVEKDLHGKYHFNGQFRNAEEIMEAIALTGDYDQEEIQYVGQMFSELFNHHAFTGRSGTFFKYEGLGCIYWHMVSKLVLAAQESFTQGVNHEGLTENTLKLSEIYHNLKAGIGMDKSPEVYGAFPTDAYSHTPGFAGVQQPGMTGQVKEDFISRFGELGVQVIDGEIHFNPLLLSKAEFLTKDMIWSLPAGDMALKEKQLGFTYCKTPIIYTLSDKNAVKVCFKNGDVYRFDNSTQLDKATSQKLFSRTGEIKKIKVYLVERDLRN